MQLLLSLSRCLSPQLCQAGLSSAHLCSLILPFSRFTGRMNWLRVTTGLHATAVPISMTFIRPL